MTYPIRTLRAKWIDFLLCVGLCLVWSGCAVPVPLSERTIFRTEYPDWERQRTVGLTATLSTARSEVQRYVQQRFDPAGPDDDVSVWNPQTRGLALGFPLMRRDRAEIDLHIGAAVLGVGGTYRLRSGWAWTTTAGWGRGQVIVQRAVLDRRNVGLGLGAFGRLDRLRVENDQPGYIAFDWADEAVYLATYGGRLMARSVWTGNVLRGSVSLGYAPALDAPVVRFGLVVYGFQ